MSGPLKKFFLFILCSASLMAGYAQKYRFRVYGSKVVQQAANLNLKVDIWTEEGWDYQDYNIVLDCDSSKLTMQGIGSFTLGKKDKDCLLHNDIDHVLEYRIVAEDGTKGLFTLTDSKEAAKGTIVVHYRDLIYYLRIKKQQ